MLLGLLTLGFVDAVVELRSIVNRHNFTTLYRDRWVAFFSEQKPEDYTWLTERIHAMTREMGGEDIVVYRARVGGLSSANYALLANTLAGSRTGDAEPEEIATADHLLLAHAGALRARGDSLTSQMKNPVALIGRGLKFVLSLPLLVLGWFGLLPPRSVERARDSWLFRLFQFVAAVAAALVAIESSVLGWSAFVAQLQSWLARFI